MHGYKAVMATVAVGNLIYSNILRRIIHLDGWLTCNVTSFATVFQSYQDDERLIMKGYVQLNPVYG